MIIKFSKNTNKKLYIRIWKKINNIYNQKIYKDKLFEELKTILGDSEKFKKFNKKRREVIANKLKELTILAEYSALFLSEVTKVPESQ